MLAAFAKGDRSAALSNWRNELCSKNIFGLANGRLGNIADAEDVTQEAFWKLWRIVPILGHADKREGSTWFLSRGF